MISVTIVIFVVADDDDDVRKECNRVKCAIEEVIGESLSDCFV